MYILKIGLVLLTGAGFGFGVDKLANNDIFTNDSGDYYGYMTEEDGYYGHMGGYGCHAEGEILEHMLEDLNEEDLLLVQGKIDELLVTYSTTLEELNVLSANSPGYNSTVPILIDWLRLELSDGKKFPLDAIISWSFERIVFLACKIEILFST